MLLSKYSPVGEKKYRANNWTFIEQIIFGKLPPIKDYVPKDHETIVQYDLVWRIAKLHDLRNPVCINPASRR